MAVAETAASQGKSASGERSGSSGAGLVKTVFNLTIGASLVFLCGLLSPQAEAQIVADRSAPGNQQPTILQTASGLPQVNIQTPSAAGVSRNIYSQFDVGTLGNKGAQANTLADQYTNRVNNAGTYNAIQGAGKAVVGGVLGAAELAVTSAKAAAGDPQAQAQLGQVVKALGDFIGSPIDSTQRVVQDTLNRANQLEASGQVDAAQQMRAELVTNGLLVVSGSGALVVKGAQTAARVGSAVADSVAASEAASVAAKAEAAAIERVKVDLNVSRDASLDSAIDPLPGVPKVVTRNDNDFTATVNAKGNPKASIDSSGNLNAANPDGTGTTYQHVLGTKPANTPYISTTDNTLTDAPKNYGGNQITIDTQQLQRDINAGNVPPPTEIITPQQLQQQLKSEVDTAQAAFDQNSSNKNLKSLERANQALGYATRDGECLIRGCVPAPYIQWPNGSTPIVPPVQPVPPIAPVQ
jgi:hypothetical protein